MDNEDRLNVTFLISGEDLSRLEDARRVLSLSEGIGGVELGRDETSGQTTLSMTYDPDATTPEQAEDLLTRYGCQVTGRQEQLAQGEGGVELATEVDLLGRPVDEA